jgi:hypothetical protein
MVESTATAHKSHQPAVSSRDSHIKAALTQHSRRSMPDLEQDEKDKRHKEGDEGGGVDRNDVFAVLDDKRSKGGELE